MSFLDNIVNNITSWASDAVNSVSDSYDDWTEPEPEPEPEPEKPSVNDFLSNAVSAVSQALPNLGVYSSGGGDIGGNRAAGKGSFATPSKDIANSVGSFVNDTYQKASNMMNPDYRGSQERLSDLQDNFNRSQEKKLAEAKELARNQLVSQYAMSGINPYDDPLFQQSYENIDTMDKTPVVYDEITRRFTDGSGNFKTNPLDWNLLGWTSQTQTPDDARRLYEYQFAKDDKTPNQVEHTWGKGSDVPEIAKYIYPSVLGLPGSYLSDERPVVSDNAIDDGSNPESRESLFMTGEQYLKYRNLGLPGRNVYEINPKKIYSKQDEQERFGFIPYLTSQESVNSFNDQAAPHFLANVFNNLGNARKALFDFTVDVDGDKISGNSLMRQKGAQLDKLYDQLNDEDRIKDYKAGEFSLPLTYVLKSDDGQTEVAPSSVVTRYDADDGIYIVFGRMNPETQEEEFPQIYPDGSLKYPDGTDGRVWIFDDEDDLNRSVGYKYSKGDDPISAWKDVDPFILPNGKKIRADEAMGLFDENSEGFYANNADYGPLNIAKPYANVFDNPTEFVPWFLDTALQSAPLMTKAGATMQAVPNVFANMNGFRGGYQNYYDDTYSLFSENPTRVEGLSAMAGSALLPASEYFLGWGGGQLGSKLFDRLSKSSPKLNNWLQSPIGRYAVNTPQEGVEEVLQNPIEDLQNYGVYNIFANEMHRDHDGNLVPYAFDEDGSSLPVAYDSQGNVIRNSNTGAIERGRNAIEDAPEAFLSGTLFGGILGLPTLASKNNWEKYRNDKNEIEEYGNILERPDFDSNLLINLSDEEREYYDRNAR